jgi:hypothetical protein
VVGFDAFVLAGTDFAAFEPAGARAFVFAGFARAGVLEAFAGRERLGPFVAGRLDFGGV